MTRSCLVLILTISSNLLFCQEISIVGKVIDTQGEPLSGAIVVCEKKDDTNTVSKFAITNDAGEWQINKLETGDYMLEVRHLGFKIKMLRFHTDTLSYLTIQMEEEPTTLEEVVVNAYKNAIKQSGDSTIYDVYKFTTGYEYNLKEVLDKLPGISTTSDGDILYNGRRIDQVLVESKDVLGNQHKLLGELFLAEYIEAVHIIENYKNEGDNLSFDRSDKVALDVKLTEEALNTWGGKIEAGAGYEDRARITTDIFNINRKISTTIFTRWNNTAEPILSLADYLSIQPSQKRALTNMENAGSLSTEFFQFPTALTANNDGLVAANVLLEPSPKHQTKFIFMYEQLNRESESELNKVYYDNEDATLEGNEFDNYKTKFIHPTINHLWKPSERLSLELELPFSITRFDQQSNFDGALNNITTQSENNRLEELNEMLPLAIFNYRLNENWYVNTNISHLKNSKKKSLFVSDLEELFDTNNLSLSVNLDNEDNISSAESNLQHTLPDSSVLGFIGGFSYQNFTMKSVSDAENLFGWDYNSSRNISTIGGNYTFRKKNFYADASFRGNFSVTDIDEVLEHQSFYDLELQAKKDFNVKTSLSMNMKIDQSLINLSQLNNDSIVVNNRELLASAISPQTKITKKEIKLSYVHLKFSTTSQMFITASINRITNNPFYETEVVDNYLINRWVVSVYEDNLNINAIYNSPLFFRKVRASANILQRNSRIKTTSNSQIEVNQSRVTLGLRTKLSGRFNYRFSITRQINGNGQSNNQFVIDNISFQQLYDTKKLHLDYEITQQTISTGSQLQNRVWELSFNGEYKLGKFRITLKGNDLFNLTGATVTQNSFEFNYLDERNFVRFPGYILTGLTYNF